MNRAKNISGFTLIELIVVISIISLLLVFSLPVFRNFSMVSESVDQAGDIVRLITDLKKRAVVKNVDYILHVDSGSGMVWVTDDTMNDEAKEAAKEKYVPISNEITVFDIEFPDIKEIGLREYQIRFRKQGYSDFSLIHIREGETDMTLRIEPFLAQVQIIDRHIYLENCN